MKITDSGMPEESYWNNLFDFPLIIDWLELKEQQQIVEIGCGYGSFTLPIAKAKPTSQLIAFDIEQEMLEITQQHLKTQKVVNVTTQLKDVLAYGTELTNDSVDLVLLFNMLHFLERDTLIKEAYRVLKPGGKIAIIHWRKDITTPRGPAMKLRPDYSDITQAIKNLKLKPLNEGLLLKPYHWGIQLIKI